MKPTICAVLIGRNEERDLPRCLKSLDGVADCIIFVDTGSTDRTFLIAADWPHCYAHTYMNASEPNPDKPGEYRIVNFAKARNHALELGELSGCSHILWLDCDDEITTPLAIRRVAYMPDACYGVWIELGGGVRQVHYRIWPAAYKIRFYGWVHEWPKLDGKPQIVLNDACIVHDATAHESSGETSNERNLRILTAQYAAEPDARTAFYIANTHKDGGRFKDAVEWYKIRLGYGKAFRDEYLFAQLYLCRCWRREGGDTAIGAAIQSAELGLIESPDWQEFRMELAFIAYDRKDWAECIAEATKALDKPIPPTVLWREKTMYTDQPARLISWCHEHLGNKAQALVWSQLATRLIGKHDEDWARREARLSAMLEAPEAPAVVKGLRRMVALHRPGAIGDILMTLNLLPAFKEANPDTDVHYFCSAGLASMDALGGIILAAGANAVMDCAGLPQWRKNYDRVIDLVGYPLAEGYPEKRMEQHLLHYFALELGLDPGQTNYQYCNAWHQTGHLPSLTLRRPKQPTDMGGRYITMQTKAGWSKYKEWPEQNWNDVQNALNLTGVPFVWLHETSGWKLSESIAMFANATMHIGIDSFCNHLTNYYWTDEHGGRRVPGVILWGSTQASAAGYPGNVNISKGLPCQPCFRENPAISRMPRDPCVHVVNKLIDDGQEYRVDLAPAKSYDDPRPHYCMDAITVDEVVEAVRETWRKATG